MDEAAKSLARTVAERIRGLPAIAHAPGGPKLMVSGEEKPGEGPQSLAGWTLEVAREEGVAIPDAETIVAAYGYEARIAHVCPRRRRILAAGLLLGCADQHDAERLMVPEGEHRWNHHPEPQWNGRAMPGDPRHITAEHAAACLKHLAQTGRVSWGASAPLPDKAYRERRWGIGA